jgi:hypothetical protein
VSRQELLDRRIFVQDFDFDLVDLIILLERMRPEILHLLVNIDERHALADVLLNFHQEVPVNLHKFLHILRIFAHSFGTVLLVLYFPLHCFFIFGKLFLNMEEEILKELAIIHNELIDYCSMHIDTRKLVRVAIDHAGHPSKVIRNLLGVGVDDEVVVAGDVLEEVAIVCVIARQRCEFYQVLPIIGLLLPEVQVVVRQNPQLLSKTLDCIDNFFDENLQDRVWSREALAIFITLLLKSVILPLLEHFLVG